MSTYHSAAAGPANPGPVHRLTFGYEGSDIRLISDQLVTMVAPPSHSLEDAGRKAGFSLIVRDGKNRALYHRSGVSPIRYDAEVFGDTPSQPISRVPVRRPRGTFVMLVPHVQGSVRVELTDAGAEEAGVAAPHTLASFPLSRPSGQD